MTYCSIYVIKNSVNKKVYVGQTWRSISARYKQHLMPSTFNHCVKLRRAMKKYGKDKFHIELIMICHSQIVSDYWEKYFISQYNSMKLGYNTLEGGGFSRIGTKHSKATRKRMSKNRSGVSNSNSIITLSQVNEIRNEYENYSNPKTGSKYGAMTKISKTYNIGISTVFDIVKGNHWK